MLKELKQAVCDASRELCEAGLAFQTFGNVSGIDRDTGQVVIKPSGVSYDEMTARQMVVVSLDSGEVIDGALRPSSDTPTHLEIYRGFAHVGAVVHTHSASATAWAQALRPIPVFGTTHADAFYGPVPCTREMTDAEIRDDYEANTGKVIVERFATLDPMRIPGVLVARHGPFTWGADARGAVHNAVLLEHLALLAANTVALEPYPTLFPRTLLDKHFLRKHGPDAYYGQDSG